MISIDAKKPAVTPKKSKKSLSQQKLARGALVQSKKKMSAEKYDRLKTAGIVK